MAGEVGKLVVWCEDRGFGFVRPDRRGGKLYLHRTEIANRDAGIKRGARVSFSMVVRDGRSQAICARVLSQVER